MEKINCYRCEYVGRQSHFKMKDCEKEDLYCIHPKLKGGVPIDGITCCPKTNHLKIKKS